jgi:hypothetical protein
VRHTERGSHGQLVDGSDEMRGSGRSGGSRATKPRAKDYQLLGLLCAERIGRWREELMANRQ